MIERPQSPGRRPPPARGTLPGWARWYRRVARFRPTRPQLARAGVVACVALLALALGREPLSERLWPDTRIQQLSDEAELALAQGRLTSSDGRGARELYEAALALDPDRAQARLGLARVGVAAVDRARASIAAKRYDDARHSLELARALAVPRATVDAVAETLREREAAGVSVEQMLARAATARAEGRLDGDADGALELYRRVLELEPDEVRALEGREDVLADLVQQARDRLRRGDLGQAAAMLERVRSVDGGHADLPAALEALERELDAVRGRAARDLRRGRLERALDGYRNVLVLRPDDPVALQGRVRVADAHAARAARLAADLQIEGAEAALREARAIAPDAPGIAPAEARLTRARQSRTRLAGESLTPERRRRLDRLLRDAAEAERRGALLAPPGANAFDHLRAARAIAPADARVRRASSRLLPVAQRCFEAELRRNRLVRASECLDAWQTLAVRQPQLDDARRRLAQRWIAVGNERLGAGELAAADAALVAARALDPAAPGLEEFAGRLRAASAGR